MLADEPVIGTLADYVGKILHSRLEVAEYGRAASLPAFMDNIYGLYEGRISGRRCILLVAGDDHGTPAAIAKHLALVRDGDDALPIFVVPSLDSHIRDRLIGQGIPFIVPGNQFYVPELGMDLREHFRGVRAWRPDVLPPTAQALLFHHLLRLNEDGTTPKRLADCLRCTEMTIGRAFDSLVAMKLANTEKRGRERHIVFRPDKRGLLNDATPYLRSPVRKERYIRGDRDSLARLIGQGPLQLAGESALAARSNLSDPPVEAYAVAYEVWKTASKLQDLVETDPRTADFVLETWRYDPLALSHGSAVDPLSLYAQFNRHGDPRVEMAAEQLLENIEW